jgi:P4 family phage/plasmid primase-like protien
MVSIEGAVYCVNSFRSVQQGNAAETSKVSSFGALFRSLKDRFVECLDTDPKTLKQRAQDDFNGDPQAAKMDMRRDVPLFNLAIPKEGALGRTLSDYRGHSAALLLDIDMSTERGFAALLERLRALGWTHFYYASHSCGSAAQRLDEWKTETGSHGAEVPEDGPVGEGPAVRYRVIIEMDRPLSVADHGRNEYAQLHSAVVGFVSAYEDSRTCSERIAEEGCLVDPCSRKMAQIYYVPAGARWKLEEMEQSYFEGEAADVDAILAEFSQQDPDRTERLTYPEMCASVEQDRILNHRKGFKKLAKSYLEETLDMISNAPKSRGTVMYPLKNDRSFAVGGFAASGALELPKKRGRGAQESNLNAALKVLKEAHQTRLANWGEDLIDSTLDVVEKAFLDGAQKPLYESHMHVAGLEMHYRELVLSDDNIPVIPPPLPTIKTPLDLMLFVKKPHLTAKHFYEWMQSEDNCGDGVMRFAGSGSWYRMKPRHGDNHWRKLHSAVGNTHAHLAGSDEDMYQRFCNKIGERIPAFKAFLIATAFKAAKDNAEIPNSMDVMTFLEALPLMEWDEETALETLAANGPEVMRSMMALAPMHSTDVRRTRFKIPVKNGVLDLETFELEEGDPLDYMTGGIDEVDFDPKAECPTFRRYLNETQPDPEMQKFLIRLMGYNLLNGSQLQKIFLHVGSGSNGKSVWKNITSRLMGRDMVGSPPSEIITAEKNDSHPELYGQLEGLRVAFLSETSNGASIDENTLKQLTGEEFLRMRRMHQNYSEIPITFKIHVLTNNLPSIYSDNWGTWRRIVVVPWDQKIPDDEQDPFLADKIEKESSGVFRLAAEAAHQLILDMRAGGVDPLRTPKQCLEANKAYHKKYDRIGDFLRAARDRDELYDMRDPRVVKAVNLDDPDVLVEFRVPIDEAWELYQRYLKRTSNDFAAHPYLSTAQFTNAIEDHGCETFARAIVGLCSAETYRKICADPGGTGLN